MVKAPDARPEQIGLMGELYPTYAYSRETGPYSTFGEALDPFISMTAYTGDLGMDAGAAQSVYSLDTSDLTMLTKPDGKLFRVDLRPGESVDLPGGAGSVSFDGLQQWVRIQISRTPGSRLALGGVVAALLGLLLSLFVRPRRVWVRARREGQGTLVEVAGLDRSEGGELDAALHELVTAMTEGLGDDRGPAETTGQVGAPR
ncbi:MAG: cytochrome c biogenesis protein ResB [Nocardioides sp.]